MIHEIPDNPGGVSCGDFTAPCGKSTAAIPNNSTSCSNNNITTSESVDSTLVVAPKSKKKPNPVLLELIQIYREVFPDNPQPHPKVISTSLQKTLSTLVKRWPELDPQGNPMTLDTFKKYLELLRDNAPKFSLGEYTTDSGTRKKNNLETFARWNTVVKFLENQYT